MLVRRQESALVDIGLGGFLVIVGSIFPLKFLTGENIQAWFALIIFLVATGVVLSLVGCRCMVDNKKRHHAWFEKRKARLSEGDSQMVSRLGEGLLPLKDRVRIAICFVLLYVLVAYPIFLEKPPL